MVFLIPIQASFWTNELILDMIMLKALILPILIVVCMIGKSGFLWKFNMASETIIYDGIGIPSGLANDYENNLQDWGQ